MAAKANKAAAIDVLVRREAKYPVKPAVPGPNGWYALGMAVEHSATQALKMLLELSLEVEGGADPNHSITITGGLPMVRAVQLGHLPSIKLLAQYGADPKKEDEQGQWALGAATSDALRLACEYVDPQAAAAAAEEDIRAAAAAEDSEEEDDEEGTLTEDVAFTGFMEDMQKTSYAGARAAVTWWKRDDELKYIEAEGETGLLLHEAKDEQVFKEFMRKVETIWYSMDETDKQDLNGALLDAENQAIESRQTLQELSAKFAAKSGSGEVVDSSEKVVTTPEHNIADTVMRPSATGVGNSSGFDSRKLNSESFMGKIGVRLLLQLLCTARFQFYCHSCAAQSCCHSVLRCSTC